MAGKDGVNFNTLNTRVTKGIKDDANTGAIDKVVAKRVEAEVNRRADILEKALDKYNTTVKELAKCVPDLKSYVLVAKEGGSEDGASIEHSAYSEKRMKERNALQKLLADLEIGIMKAMNDGDYSKLQQLATSGKPGKSENGSEE